MCYKHDYFYCNCRHIKKTIIAPCDAGYDEETEQCHAHIYQGSMVYVNRPSYCPPCYRKIEANICDRADGDMAKIQDDIRHMRDTLKNVEGARKKLVPGSEILEAADANHMGMVADLQLFIAIAERKGRRNRQYRAEALKEFRDSQGVWGDG